MQITLIHASSSTQTTDPPACVCKGGRGLGATAGRGNDAAEELILYDLDVISDSVFTHIRRLSACGKVLVVADPMSESCLWSLFRAGAAGLVLRDSPIRGFRRAVLEMSLGRIYVDPGLTKTDLNAANPTALQGLTQRERDVLRLMAKGFTNRQMAAALMISVRTVETHRANLQHKLGAQGRSEVILFAERLGWLDEHVGSSV